ncbi:MAG: hypothetical protein LPL00_07600 [Alphaproteobacteria bacterium]|nr:hypothetical protein [Alphaproteobacteria bacterium]MDX5369427.1 hypothetical protein [Alphaproteobacteria bacterium]MDX5464111.1 hypothetical protein [Alphaproteobacteria bacterium]
MATAELRGLVISAMRDDGKVDAGEFSGIVKDYLGGDISDAAIDRAFGELSGSDLSTPLALQAAVGNAEDYDAEMDAAAGSDVDEAAVQDDVLDALSDDDQVSFAEFEAIYNKHGDGSMSPDELRDLYQNADSFDAASMTDALMEAFGSGPDAGLMQDLEMALADDGQITFAEFQALYDKYGDGSMSSAELRDAYKSGSSFSADAMASALAGAGVTAAGGSGTSAGGSGTTGGGTSGTNGGSTSANGSGATGGTSGGGGGTADKDADYFYPFAAGGIGMFLPADGVSTFDTFKQGVVDTIVNDGGDAAWVTDAVIRPSGAGLADKSDFDQIGQAAAGASAAASANGTGAPGGGTSANGSGATANGTGAPSDVTPNAGSTGSSTSISDLRVRNEIAYITDYFYRQRSRRRDDDIMDLPSFTIGLRDSVGYLGGDPTQVTEAVAQTYFGRLPPDPTFGQILEVGRDAAYELVGRPVPPGWVI